MHAAAPWHAMAAAMPSGEPAAESAGVVCACLLLLSADAQAVLSLLPAAANSGAAASLSLRHTALQHFATAARLASFIRRADLAEAAARLAHNTIVAPGGLLESGLTRASCVQLLRVAATALNATRPADIGFQVRGVEVPLVPVFCHVHLGAVIAGNTAGHAAVMDDSTMQECCRVRPGCLANAHMQTSDVRMCVLAQVKLNLLLLECLSAAGLWKDARQHAEAFHRSLPLAKHKGPTAAAALEALAAWRATCVVKAGPGHAMEDMPRLLSELSTAQAKVCAYPFLNTAAWPVC